MIRLAKNEDASRIAEIHVYGWRYAYSEFISEIELYKNKSVIECFKYHEERIIKNEIQEYVYEDEEIIKGFMIPSNSRDDDKKDAFELCALYVEPIYKRKGIGRELLSYFEKLAMDNNKKESIIWVLEDNENARRFYEKYGYKQDGAKKEIEKIKLTEIRYCKIL